jgi:hypothetical protein
MARSGWTARGVLILLLSVALGCEAVPPRSRPGADSTDAGCVFRVSPDAALRADVEAAAERWSAAAQCEVELGEGGAPIRVVASIVRPDGTQAPGWTSPERDRVEINVRLGAEQRARTVLHELGHLLGGDHTASDAVLSGEKGWRPVIDTEALVSVCSRLPCGAINPEVP